MDFGNWVYFGALEMNRKDGDIRFFRWHWGRFFPIVGAAKSNFILIQFRVLSC